MFEALKAYDCGVCFTGFILYYQLKIFNVFVSFLIMFSFICPPSLPLSLLLQLQK